jgi:exonuclease VII large subunit
MVEAVTARVTLTIAQRNRALERFVHYSASFAQRRRAAIEASASALVRRVAEIAVSTRDRLTAAERLIVNLNPARLLGRGYSMTTVRGRIVRDAAALAVGDRITTRFAHGDASSVVDALSTR